MKQKIIDIILGIVGKGIPVSGNSHIKNDLGMTSLEMLLFVTKLESEFGCDIPIKEVIKWNFVDDVEKYLGSR